VADADRNRARGRASLMKARYAIYYAPAADNALALRAAAWLGRDPYSGQIVDRGAHPTLDHLDLDALTKEPRGYGFHATLKAPFELEDGTDESALIACLARLAASFKAFSADIVPARIGRFIAFRLAAPTPLMETLHGECMKQFEPYRAPLSEFDLARRRKVPLTPEQDARLVTWGYPYVFEDFRFHMTLTGSIKDEAVSQLVLETLRDHFAEFIGPHLFDGLCIFKQEDRAGPFQVFHRAAFRAGPPG